MRTITFNTKGHDDFIDFIKAYAIICVLFGHTFLYLDVVAYGVWAGMQVPLFILVQCFHYFKKDNSNLDFSKLFRRVFMPFAVTEILTCIAAFLFTSNNGENLRTIFLNEGGFGPGAYYPWIYFQMALLLPLFSFFCRKLNRPLLLAFFIVIAEVFEIFFSIIEFPEWLYRLLAVRYLFLIYMGWIWVKDGIRINITTIFLSIISLLAIIYFEYFTQNNEPWFFTTNWRYHRWPCYFFVANGFTALLYELWKILSGYEKVQDLIKKTAAASYEIFLIQMAVIFLLDSSNFTFIDSIVLRYVLWMLIVWVASLFGGIVLNLKLNKTKV